MTRRIGGSAVSARIHADTSRSYAGDDGRYSVAFDAVGHGDDLADVSNDQLVIPAAGFYVLTAKISYQDVPDGTELEAAIEKNGTSTVVGQHVAGAANPVTGVMATDVRELEAGDVIELKTSQDSGASLDTNVANDNASQSTFLAVFGQ